MWAHSQRVDFQSKFRAFHEAIKLSDRSHQSLLREKRDRILDRMRDNLRGRGLRFDFFNQGSYAMRTGVRPLDGDYDLDVGVVFSGHSVPDPLTAKEWVYDAVAGHTSQVDWKEPCITVQYVQGGQPRYHVDLAVMWDDGSGLWLARGKRHSAPPHRRWEQDDRRRFVEMVRDHHSGDDRDQFRRIVRYLKRWRDVHFPSTGRAAPVGIGLTVLVLRSFTPAAGDDLRALRHFVDRIRGEFGWNGRITAKMPVAPHDDVFERMSDQQMREFKGHLDNLSGWLGRAEQSGDASWLRHAFGDDFPT